LTLEIIKLSPEVEGESKLEKEKAGRRLDSGSGVGNEEIGKG
jgi:hypothetical protein